MAWRVMTLGPARDWQFLGAVLFELSLVGVAAVLGRWLEVVPPRFDAERLRDANVAILVALPPLAFLWWSLAVRSGPIAQVREQAREALGDLLANRGFGGMLLLAVAAGLGEELLFRGVLQTWFARHLGIVAAAIAAAVVFGLCHALSVSYFLYATSMGCYFGAAMAWTERLEGPILAHVLFDACAFHSLQPKPPAEAPKETPPCPQD